MKKERGIKKQLKEAISAGALSPLGYSVLVDASNVLENKRGLIKSMFPSTNSAIIKKWFSKISLNDKYGESKEKLMALGSRFSDTVALKVLYKSLNALKSTPLRKTEKEQREKDIQKMIDKVASFIRKRLTDEDAELIEKFTNSINSVANNIAGEIDNELQNSVQSPESEKPIEEPKKEPAKPIEKPKVESKVNERLKNKLRKKIKEIIRTQMTPTQLPPEKPFLHQQTLHDIAALIRKDWKNVYFGAKPYLDAMSRLTNISDRYGADNAKTIVLYFLANASTWRGDTARAVKAHLKSLVK